MRLKLNIAYDGRPFRGWQSQPGGDTVQDCIETAISEILGEEKRIHGSGRTDTGVHALAQIAHFDAPENKNLTIHDWQRALNAKLPPTIRINSCEQAADDFHARFNATGKQYRYRIIRTDVMPPHELGMAWHVYGELDLKKMKSAAEILTGEHDFRAFSANRGEGSEPASTSRELRKVALDEQKDILTIDYEGNGFLYKMARMLTAALVRVAQNRESVETLGSHLCVGGNPACPKSTGCAPAEGLYLLSVSYDSER